MIDIYDLISSIREVIAANAYLAAQLTNNSILQVYYGVVPQQTANSQTITPYCAIYTITTGEQGNFGSIFLDTVVLQFSVWTNTFSVTSSIIEAIGILFNNNALPVSDNTLVGIKRNSSARITAPGQDTNNKYIYQGTIDFQVIVSGC
jgi:hypothetical protein